MTPESIFKSNSCKPSSLRFRKPGMMQFVQVRLESPSPHPQAKALIQAQKGLAFKTLLSCPGRDVRSAVCQGRQATAQVASLAWHTSVVGLAKTPGKQTQSVLANGASQTARGESEFAGALPHRRR
uniref:Uncharacterized protein n=1 Tax=Coccidioides posadasii RMSCC 3488 TaxID=454284 RepID=A0A0J6F828_COCPO|nr:hypothetical protein CPAG_05453 [Coccidioides posadasii RMSCC 3488]